MKTNPFARGVLKIRGIVICLALITMVGFSFSVGESLAARAEQASAPQTGVPQPPQVSLADAMAAARY